MAKRALNDIPVPDRELIRAEHTAQLLSISRSLLYKWAAAGDIPAPVQVGDLRLWRRRELEDWASAGCPNVKLDFWRWQPTVTAKIDTIIAAKTREVQGLSEELDQLRALLAKGQTLVGIRRE